MIVYFAKDGGDRRYRSGENVIAYSTIKESAFVEGDRNNNNGESEGG